MSATLADATQVLYAEALALDEQRWADWLALYTEDALFWVPTWIEGHQLSTDPMRELSLIWCQGRAGLEDRIARIRSGLSAASRVLPRTVHAIHNVMPIEATSHRLPGSDPAPSGNTAGSCALRSVFTVHQLDLRSQQTQVFFGHYEHHLRQDQGRWRIAMKKIVLKNDLIPTMVDIYSL